MLLKWANNVQKLPGEDYVANTWVLAMMLKALPLVHFWSVYCCRKNERLISVKETLKTLVLSAEKWSISSETALKIPTKSAIFLLFFGKVCPWKSQEIWLFTSTTYQKPCKYLCNLSMGLILATLSRVCPGKRWRGAQAHFLQSK